MRIALKGLRQMVGEKPSMFSAIFMGLSLTPITNIWSTCFVRFVTLGTHSILHKGQMSHICDISPLRINNVGILQNI